MKPMLVPHTELKRRSVKSHEGLAALFHALAHIELNAVDLAADLTWRFADLPDEFYRDWAQVAREEAYHFGLLSDRLAALALRGPRPLPLYAQDAAARTLGSVDIQASHLSAATRSRKLL